MSEEQIIDMEPEATGIARLIDAVEAGDRAALKAIIESSHEADISDQLEQMSDEDRAALVELAPGAITPEILSELEDEVLEGVLAQLGAKQIAEALTELDSDDATAVLEELDDDRVETVLSALSDADRRAVEESFLYEEETAGRLMQREFVAAPEFWTVGQVIDHMRAQGDNLPDLFFNIYIVDTKLHPTHYVPLSQIMRHPRKTVISDIAEEIIVSIPREMDQEDIAYQFEKYHLISAPVVDSDGLLCGLITVDDIVAIIREENSEDLLALAGVSDAGLTDTAMSTVKARAPWLLINLMTAILASLVISLFDMAISQYVALAILMPIVASMGGNAGTQTLAVAVRDIADRDLTKANARRAVLRETLAGALNGVIFAVVLAIITMIWFSDQQLAIVIFIAMIVNHICAALAGILVPLGLKRIGADPAVSSSVFVTTVTDVVGFFAFLGTAVLMLF